MNIKYGLDNFDGGAGNNCLLLLKPAETRTVRFLLEPSKMPIIRRHWVHDHGYIHCNGAGCPLCRKASSEWGAPITVARDYFLAPLIDRTDNKVRAFEGGKAVKDKLLKYSRGKVLTQFDFRLSRSEGKKGQDLYNLIPVDMEPSPLTVDESERINALDQDWLLRRGVKSNEEIEAILEEGEVS
jgi:hypothetical protein